MKKLISIALSVLTLLALCLLVTSCSTEQITPFSRMADYLKEQGTVKVEVDDVVHTYISFVEATAETLEGSDETQPATIELSTAVHSSSEGYRMTLEIVEGADEHEFTFLVSNAQTGDTPMEFKGHIASAYYDGEALISFDKYEGSSVMFEPNHREVATSMMNGMLSALDETCHSADLTAADLGFTALSEKLLYSEGEVEAEENLGGAFSGARWLYVGQMLLLGMGMVFFVLAILWMILLIFEKAMGTKPAKGEKKAEAPAAMPATNDNDAALAAAIAAAMVATEDEGATVAAITAAISTMIASDETLSKEFAGGFRVVSFSRKSGKGAWNQ